MEQCTAEQGEGGPGGAEWIDTESLVRAHLSYMCSFNAALD